MRIVSPCGWARYNKERANAKKTDSGIVFATRFKGDAQRRRVEAPREAAEQVIKGTGGRLEAYDYAFGSDDFVIIADLPSNVDAAALSFAVNASGAVSSRMTVLITPEEADQATEKMKTVTYRPPGT